MRVTTSGSLPLRSTPVTMVRTSGATSTVASALALLAVTASW